MGADIYLESVHDEHYRKYNTKFQEACVARDAAETEEARSEAQKRVEKYYNKMYQEGYFRDSYNGTSLFWLIGLSWWKDIHTDDKGYLSVDGCKELLAEVSGCKIPDVAELKTYLEGHNVVLDEDENSPEVWRKFFMEKKEMLVKFLGQVIELNEPLRCSV